MVSPYIAGAVQGLEKGFAAQELKKQNDLKSFLALKKIESDEATNKIAKITALGKAYDAGQKRKSLENMRIHYARQETEKLKRNPVLAEHVQ